MASRQVIRVVVGGAVACCLFAAAPAPAEARSGAPPRSHVDRLAPLEQVAVLELDAIDRDGLMAEDDAAKAGSRAKPLRFASPADVELTPDDVGTWERTPEGGWVWRLRVHAPKATDLNFGFARYRLAEGATLHIWSEDYDYVEGPYTASDASHAGDLWTPVVPGERAVVELHEPAGVSRPSDLVLGRVGRGYRDLFRLDEVTEAKAALCNVDAVCPEGDLWRDELRSVARITISGAYLCSGTLVMDVPGSYLPYFLTAYHCEIRSHNASTVVAYWNFESPTCGALGGGSLAENQTGSIFRAGREDNDLCLIELEEDPDPSFNVHFAGWDARTTTAPQATFSAHHPQGDEKMLTVNDDPMTTIPSCIVSGPAGTHWNVADYEAGTTEGGSSGSALWDAATHLIVGYLSGGGAACSSPINDCYGKLPVGFDGASADTRLKDWLDPGGTGTRFVAGSDPGGGGGTIRYEGNSASDSCASGQGNANGVWEPGETIQIAVDLSATAAFSSVQGTLTSSTPGVTIVDGTAGWPDLSPAGGAVGSNPPHFTIRLGTSVPCWTTIQLSLRVTAAEGGPFTFQLSHPVGSSLQPNVPVAIADLGAAVSTLQVGQDVTLYDANVRVQINHSYVGDLMVTLRSPAGTTVTLLNRPSSGSCGDENMDVTFDDASSVNLQNWCNGTNPWYSGIARPAQPLSAFNGQSSAGTWTLTVSDHAAGDSGTVIDWELITTPALYGVCQSCSGGGAAAYEYMVAGIAHAPGLEGSNWRSKLALLNRSGTSAQVTLSYVRSSGAPLSQSLTLAINQLVAWDDVAVSLFGVSADSSGAIKVGSSQPLIVTARTYNASADGTYGQFLPGVDETEALAIDGLGVISQLAKNADFRSNIGFVNLGEADCRVRVTLRNSSGGPVGSQRTLNVPAGGWKQDNDIFEAAGAGTHANAYATVEVLTEGCQVWGYGSVVDNRSGDPTTIPMLRE